MYEKKDKILSQTKSYTSIYEIFGSTPFNNVLYRKPNKCEQEQFICTAAYSDTIKKSPQLIDNTRYVTSEKYHRLNKNDSNKNFVPSTSTIFYDLDNIAKRHSFHCLTEISLSNDNVFKAMKMPAKVNVFGRKSEAIVQDCIAEVKPKLVPRDSIEVNLKKAKRNNIMRNIILSSEIFLRDETTYENTGHQSPDYDKNIRNKHQKFWSYAKYNTEYTKPIIEQKRVKKKNRGKRTEDPCPCQLFSYACSCTDKKSLTKLAKNSKSLTVRDQVTSTTIVCLTKKTDIITNKEKKRKGNNTYKDDKPTNTSFKLIKKATDNEPIMQLTDKQNSPIISDANKEKIETYKNDTKPQKRPWKLICPNCKEKVNVISTTEEEEEERKNETLICRSKEMLSTTAYTYRASPRSIIGETVDGAEVCTHEPPCELVPVCQILSGDDNKYCNSKTTKTQYFPKSSPRVIRITKACRHHPPCTVVPSCQRANVLKNNCEYIPPCLHRPRCVNLPLCVPFSRAMHFDDTLCTHIQNNKRNIECPHIPRCKYMPVCQHDSLVNNMDQHTEMVSHMQNTYKFTNSHQTPAFLANPPANGMRNSYSPFHLTSPYSCSCRSNKSCQYDSTHVPNGNISNETVVFIRDVGCQFRSKNYTDNDCLMKSKASSSSIDYVDVKIGNYYTSVHTLRYEDKFTSPLSEAEISESSFSVTNSMEIDSQCPSHGQKVILKDQRTGFNPKTTYVTAYNTRVLQLPTRNIKGKTRKCELDDSKRRECYNPFFVKSRRSFLKRRHNNMFTVKRKKKSNTSKHVISDHSKTKNIVTKTYGNYYL